MTDPTLLYPGDRANPLAHGSPTLIDATRRPELAVPRPISRSGGVR